MPTANLTVRIDRKEIQERIARLPRVRLAFTPTPLEDGPRLSKAPGGPRIFFKHEDLTGFAFGGNKVRAMEFRLGHVQANGYNAFVLVNIGQATAATLEAIRLAARTERIFLDPVYSGKALSGLIGETRKGNVGKDETLVFVHAGGTPIIFAYDELLANL